MTGNFKSVTESVKAAFVTLDPMVRKLGVSAMTGDKRIDAKKLEEINSMMMEIGGAMQAHMYMTALINDDWAEEGLQDHVDHLSAKILEHIAKLEVAVMKEHAKLTDTPVFN